MNFRKIISLMLAAVMLCSFAVMPVFADEAEDIVNTVTYINDDFEDGDISDWAFRENVSGGSAGTKSATVVEEDGNKFMRVSYTGTHVNGNGRIVMFSKKFSDGKFDMPDDGVTVLEFKFRTNQTNLRKMFKYNYPTESKYTGDCYNEYSWNTRGVAMAHTDNTISYYYSNAGGDNYMQGNGTVITDDYSTNVWYDVKMIFDYGNSKMYFVLGSEEWSNPLKSGAKSMDAWWFKYHDQNRAYPIEDQLLEDFTIAFRNGVEVTDERVDIDDFKVYTQKSVVTAEVIPNREEGFVYLPEELSFKFDAPVNMAEGAVTVVDENGDTVSHTGSYNEKTLTYTASFGSLLPAGNYSFVINPDLAVPVNESEGIFDTMSHKEEQVSFTVYDVLPPVADDVSISGRVISGDVITANYTYNSDADEGSSIYEWYMADSADAEENEWLLIDGQDSKELVITDEIEGKYIKFAVTPVNMSGISGEKVYSNIIAPELAPEAKNPELSTSFVFTNSYVSAMYEYFDANGDEEAESEINWYVSDNGIDGWEKVSEGKNYHITETEIGKYIKFTVVPVNKALRQNRGELVESAVTGPVTDLISATNKFVNPGFEDGVLTPWTYSTNIENYKGIELTNEAVYSGDYSIYAYGRPVSNASYSQEVALEAGKTYILSAMIRSGDSSSYTGYEGYDWAGNLGDEGRPYRNDEKVTITPQWQRVTLTMRTSTTGNYALGFTSFNPLSATAFIDDHYVGELLISDIESTPLEPVTIPKEGTVEIPFVVGRVLNQFGEVKGLTTQTANMNIPSHPGVTYKNNKIIVDSTATAGKIDIELTCTPTYQGAAQQSFVKIVELELLPHDDNTPKAINVTAVGSVAEGNTLTGSYDFYQVDNKTDASSVRWMYSDSANGVYYDIPGAVSDTYVVESAYADKYIKFAVTPKTSDGIVGTDVMSDYLTVPKAPTAINLTIDGDFNVGGTVTGSYELKDENRDAEGISTFKWYVSDTQDGVYTEIQGKNTKNLVFDESMINKYIKFAVTPVSDTYPETGTEVRSEAYIGPATPVVSNIVIENKDGRLVATYDYYHPHNAAELNSTYEWKVDGVLVSTNPSYTIGFEGAKLVTFSVTPVANSNPSKGKTASLSTTIMGLVPGNVGGGSASGGGGGSSSGGFGGGNIASGITSINDMNYQEPQKDATDKEETKTDLTGHWGADYIRIMESRGVMTADENGNYNPDINVSREEMVTYLFDALKLTETEYSRQFADVADSDFAKKLQTMLDNGTIAKDTNFRPNDTISREEMCKILYVSLKNAGKLAEVEEGLINTFADFDNISDWAKVYVNAIYGNKIMVGVSDTEFDAKGTVTKAQAATMLVRIISFVEGE